MTTAVRQRTGKKGHHESAQGAIDHAGGRIAAEHSGGDGMSTSIPFEATQGRERPVRTANAITVADAAGTAARAGAWVVLLGIVVTTVGTSWDIQWHTDVGPDTFFTLPHLFLYSGSAISGFASLAMVVLTTSAQRAGREVPRGGGTPIRVFGGALTAPIGYIVAGAGAALFLLYGLFDLEWHSIYGFDAVLNTPSHVALFLSISVTMVGGIVVCAAARDRGWGRAGLLLAIPVLIAFGPTAFNGLSALPLPVDPGLLGILFCAPTLLIMGATLLGDGAAVRIAVVLGILQAVLWWFSPWATRAYADVVGLPMRDGLAHQAPELPNAIPMFLIVAAVAVEILFRPARAVRLGTRALVVFSGLIAGLVVGAGLAVQMSLFSGATRVNSGRTLALSVLGLLLGPLAAYLGTRFAVLLRVQGDSR